LKTEPARVPLVIEPMRSLGGRVDVRGLWVLDGKLYEMVAAPIVAPLVSHRHARLGAVLVGIQIGELPVRFLARIMQITQTDLVLLTDGQVMASRFPARLSAQLLQRLAGLPEGRVGRVEVGSRSYLAWKQGSPIDFGGRRYTQVILRSLEGANQLAYQIGRGLIAVGLGGVALVVLFACRRRCPRWRARASSRATSRASAATARSA
jgi:hypothetical protein